MVAGKSGGTPSITDSALGRSVVISETTAGVTQFTDVSQIIYTQCYVIIIIVTFPLCRLTTRQGVRRFFFGKGESYTM